MESKNKTTPAVLIKQPLQYVGPHFLKQCVNDKGINNLDGVHFVIRNKCKMSETFSV